MSLRIVVIRGARSARKGAATAALIAAAVPAAAEGPVELSLPLACEIGKTCFVQNYVDLDPGAGARDYACLGATYDGHSGTDFRLLSARETEAGVDVLAAAPGTVKGVRDGERDVFVRDGGRETIKGRECGNGLVIDHGQGWETQYCHMRRGSLAVRPGDVVTRGQRLGSVGYSGLADFAHLHLSVRVKGATVDPFLHPSGDRCEADPARARGLWDRAAAAQLAYADGALIGAGFTTQALETGDLERTSRPDAPHATSQQILFFARAIRLRAEDRIRITVIGPQGFAANATTQPVDRFKAVYVAYAGKALKEPRWPAGNYQGTAEVIRAGRTISTMSATLEVRP